MRRRQGKAARGKASSTLYIAPPVQRAVKLLRHIAEGDPVVNLSETAKKLSINRTTLLRLLHTLEVEGVVESRHGEAGYQIGISFVALAARVVFSQDLLRIAVPVVAKLAETVGMSAHLGVLDGTDVLYLLRRTPSVPLASTIRIGSRLPAHATTMGRIILAHMDPADVDELFGKKPLARFTEHTPTTLAELHALLKRERSDGISWSDGYFESGIGSVAVAILDFAGDPVGALNISGPLNAFRDKARRRQMESELRSAGVEISRRLGWVEPLSGKAEFNRTRSASRRSA